MFLFKRVPELICDRLSAFSCIPMLRCSDLRNVPMVPAQEALRALRFHFRCGTCNMADDWRNSNWSRDGYWSKIWIWKSNDDRSNWDRSNWSSSDGTTSGKTDATTGALWQDPGENEHDKPEHELSQQSSAKELETRLECEDAQRWDEAELEEAVEADKSEPLHSQEVEQGPKPPSGPPPAYLLAGTSARISAASAQLLRPKAKAAKPPTQRGCRGLQPKARREVKPAQTGRTKQHEAKTKPASKKLECEDAQTWDEAELEEVVEVDKSEPLHSQEVEQGPKPPPGPPPAHLLAAASVPISAASAQLLRPKAKPAKPPTQRGYLGLQPKARPKEKPAQTGKTKKLHIKLNAVVPKSGKKIFVPLNSAKRTQSIEKSAEKKIYQPISKASASSDTDPGCPKSPQKRVSSSLRSVTSLAKRPAAKAACQKAEEDAKNREDKSVGHNDKKKPLQGTTVKSLKLSLKSENISATAAATGTAAGAQSAAPSTSNTMARQGV